MPEKGKVLYIGEIESLEIKIDLLAKEKEELVKENLLLQQEIK